MKKILILVALCCLSLGSLAQAQFGEKPKLVVGIVVDQMRWDYLDRYYEQFCDGGFRRLIDQGFSCNNCLINYLPTVTAIGHASVYTGTTPAFHGICGNNFYVNGRNVSSCQDDSMQTVGSSTSSGKRSPHHMVATTIGDQLRLHTDFLSKVVGVSYKDRAAILPAGHSANAAYWLDTKELRFITSTYYMEQLPDYVEQVNTSIKRNKAVQQMGDRIGYSPLCGDITTEMAIGAMKGEQLGKGKATDMLCVSYSQTDVIGHEWSTRGERIDKAYLSLDKNLKQLFEALDEQVGSGQWVAFLTADHAAAHNWNFMREHKLPAGPVYGSDIRKEAEKYLAEKLGATKPVIAAGMNYRIFLDYQSIAEQQLDVQAVKDALVAYLKTRQEIVTAVDFEKARVSALPQLLIDRVLMGYYPGRSGDIIAIPKPQYYSWWSTAPSTHTTHSGWNPYDAHIPCLFLGWKIPHGATSREVHITDIAPTICQLLHIQQPNACVGEAITEITK